MKTKKYLIAFAIIGGLMFTAYNTTTTLASQDGEQTTQIKKGKRKILADANIKKGKRKILASNIKKGKRKILADANIKKGKRKILASNIKKGKRKILA